MKIQTVYQTDDNGYLLYAIDVNEFALQPGRFNVPFMAVEPRPPESPEGFRARWASPHPAGAPAYGVEGDWALEPIPEPVPEAPCEPDQAASELDHAEDAPPAAPKI